MRKSVGMAIEITPENAPMLAIVNGGLPVFYQSDPKCYFVFPYDPDGHCEIHSEKLFFSEYSFAETPDPTRFVDVVEV